jgi:hypothetical protein
MIADFDFGDVSIERAIAEEAGFALDPHQCKSEESGTAGTPTGFSCSTPTSVRRPYDPLDDLEEEPAKHRYWQPPNPLRHLPNTVVTPHAAYYSEESVRTVRTIATEEAVRVLTGHDPQFPVNTIRR